MPESLPYRTARGAGLIKYSIPVEIFILVKFVLNPDFTAFQLFGANTTNSISGQEIVTGGTGDRWIGAGADVSGVEQEWEFAIEPVCLESGFYRGDV